MSFKQYDANGNIKDIGATGSNGVNGTNGAQGPVGVSMLLENGADGENGIGIPGRAVQIYEQSAEPLQAQPGDFWITPA